MGQDEIGDNCRQSFGRWRDGVDRTFEDKLSQHLCGLNRDKSRGEQQPLI